MKNILKAFIIVSCFVVLSSCSTTLLAPQATYNLPLNGYKYVYITPTKELSSSVGTVYGNQYGTYGSTQSNTLNPSDVISGIFLKKGYTRLPELNSSLLGETIIVNYGESGRRDVGIWGAYSIEVTIQLISAESSQLLCVGTAEGLGHTEVDDIRIAITRCLDKIFENN